MYYVCGCVEGLRWDEAFFSAAKDENTSTLAGNRPSGEETNEHIERAQLKINHTFVQEKFKIQPKKLKKKLSEVSPFVHKNQTAQANCFKKFHAWSSERLKKYKIEHRTCKAVQN